MALSCSRPLWSWSLRVDVTSRKRFTSVSLSDEGGPAMAHFMRILGDQSGYAKFARPVPVRASIVRADQSPGAEWRLLPPMVGLARKALACRAASARWRVSGWR